MEITKRFLLACAMLALAGPARADYAVTFAQVGEKVKVQIKDTAEGWTWESRPIDGQVVPHHRGDATTTATVQDMDADDKPEVVVAIADGAPGGSVYVFKRDGQAFRPIPVEVGPNVGTRDFLVWDLEGTGGAAPVTITPFGHIEIRGHLFALLGQSTGVGLFRWRVSRGMVRHVETIASKP